MVLFEHEARIGVGGGYQREVMRHVSEPNPVTRSGRRTDGLLALVGEAQTQQGRPQLPGPALASVQMTLW
ncbi:MAG: hypothetical protein CVT68_11415 [Actinobacteria bacterium HGW-Actinobacteria-8]|nr:MAG: hypothetical protein CVT68_11415 [Actinobacteria bacterium HGW-Actinobacteria-8]